MILSPDQKLAAYFLGRRIAGQRRKQDRVPLAYLYNAVRLPGLPEWDKEKYPNVFMYRSVFGYRALFSENPCYEVSDDGVWLICVIVGEPALQANSAGTEWEKWDTVQISRICAAASVTWANFDILDSAGNTILPASEPIPVYE